MGNKPLKKRCKYGCGMIPTDLYADHLYCHEAQVELFDTAPLTKPTEPKNRRQRANGLA